MSTGTGMSPPCRPLRTVTLRALLTHELCARTHTSVHLLFLDESGQLSERRFFALGGVVVRDRDWHTLRDFWQATLGEHAGVDLWHYRTPDGAGIRKALDFLLPYVEDPQKPWPYEHGKKAERRNIASLLRRAYYAYHDPRYVKALSPESSSQLDALFYAVD